MNEKAFYFMFTLLNSYCTFSAVGNIYVLTFANLSDWGVGYLYGIHFLSGMEKN